MFVALANTVEFCINVMYMGRGPMAEHFKSLSPGTVRTAGTGSGNNIWGTAGKKIWGMLFRLFSIAKSRFKSKRCVPGMFNMYNIYLPKWTRIVVDIHFNVYPI